MDLVSDFGRRARLGRAGRDLRFATVFIDQACGGSGQEAQIRPVLQWVAGLEWRARDACSHELIVSRPISIGDVCRRRAKFRDDAPVRGHGNPFATFNSTHILTQIVLELANACRNHAQV
jgi:hypothetical protein